MGVGFEPAASPADFLPATKIAGKQRATQARASAQTGLTACVSFRPAIVPTGAASITVGKRRAGRARCNTADLTATHTAVAYYRQKATTAAEKRPQNTCI